MKISCPSCSAKYSLADEKVVGRLAKIRCRKCGTSIIIDGHTDPPAVTTGEADAPVAASAAAEAPAASVTSSAVDAGFTIDFGENDQRTMSMQEIIEAYNAGNISAESYVWAEGFTEWTALGQVDTIVTALNDAASASATPAPSQSAAASADLFGATSDVTASSPGVIPAAGLSANTPAAQELAAPTASESSVLFSLSALTSQATNSRPSMPAQSAGRTNDDSGLIDLKALTEAAAHHQANSAAAPAPVAAAVSPLGASPLGASPAHATASTKPASKGPLFIGLGLAVVAICGTIVFVTAKGEPVAAPPTPVAAVVKTAPPSAALPAPLPVADDTEDKKKAEEEKAAAEKKAEEEKAAAEKLKKKAPARSTSSRTSTPKKATSKPAPKKAAAAPKKAAPPRKKTVSKKKCPCKSDDFLCIMKKCS